MMRQFFVEGDVISVSSVCVRCAAIRVQHTGGAALDTVQVTHTHTHTHTQAHTDTHRQILLHAVQLCSYV